MARGTATVFVVLWLLAPNAASGQAANDPALSAAICPIVYQVDQRPLERGYHYLFYGNGFFINEQGYVVTALHVLSQLHGGQPYVLLRSAEGPPQLVKAVLAAADREHDVAVLRVTPNPFEGKYKVAFLPLALERVAQAKQVLAATLRPSAPKDPHTLDALVEDRPTAEIIAYQFSQLYKGRSDTELFLFNHEVRPGQSGAPMLSSESQEVVGLVEGRWLRPSPRPAGSGAEEQAGGVGAAVPAHYAIALLQQKGIAWHSAPGALERAERDAAQAAGAAAPFPLSIVTAPYPSQALFGGEVVLDGLVDSRGRLKDIGVVRGAAPFLDKAMSAVRTWSFLPARVAGLPVDKRIGIVFEFPQSFTPLRSKTPHEYAEPLTTAPFRGALPVKTIEPESPPAAAQDGSVVLYEEINSLGESTSVRMLRGTEPLGQAAVAAVREWRFVPGKEDGKATDSALVVAMIFRRGATAGKGQTSGQVQ